ncbi:MAG: hypothetical protein US42_C0001G0020 [Candidatus Magasanikbacteria bacterium GW2011_GWC2_37_14]|uniref:Uncharacterized protein n=1 Tax=Candidatus Magasanikbacteria bacterium GW2011_GWC2_37_14 TaxID=1619046 RepID=A0A0G0IVL1_9BACT|nr:MAG: hypothetical protein US42_C0001G0020 [Candidatus Magasanikbacteria bacterium GW2011_GWC2_37_14]
MWHQNTAERWQNLSLAEQLGNVGSEFGRVTAWQTKNKNSEALLALERTLELLDLSITDSRWQNNKRNELLRLREVICDNFLQSGHYLASSSWLENYFLAFAIFARKNKT